MFQPNKIIEVSDISRPFQVVSDIYSVLKTFKYYSCSSLKRTN